MDSEYIEKDIDASMRNGEKKKFPGLIHKYCPGIAVIMTGFGYFNVTHINSGLKITDDYERACSAILVLSQLAIIANDIGFEWDDLTSADIVNIIDKNSMRLVTFEGETITTKDGSRKMTIGEYINSINPRRYVEEFPWEELHPSNLAMLNFCNLSKDKENGRN